MDRIETAVSEYIKKYDMIRPGDKVVTGVSGGADSVCLLFLLCGLSRWMGFSVVACHVNHCLRGEQADRDQAFVERLCESHRVPCHVFVEDVEWIARKRKQSLEEAGREIRREALEEVCRREGASKIALAHHQDDNAETMLLNLARGTGLKGMCGILPIQGKWIRPLLCLEREEIERWLEDRGIPYCTDATNEGDEYARNRIRHHVIPVLREQVNAGAVRHFNEWSMQATEIWEYLQAQVGLAWDQCVSVDGDGRIFMDEKKVLALDRAIRGLLIKECIVRAAGKEKDLGRNHVEALETLFSMQPGRKRDLPYRVRAKRVYGGVLLEKREGRKKEEPALAQTEIPLLIPGKTSLGDGRSVECSFCGFEEEKKAKDLPQKSYTKCFDYDIIENSLSIRCRKPGDFIAVGGGHRQKLKAYFINEKIPKEERDRMFLVADGNHIIWIPGRRMSSDYQISGRTERILKITITEEQDYGRENQGSHSRRESG